MGSKKDRGSLCAGTFEHHESDCQSEEAACLVVDHVDVLGLCGADG